ncbi:MAG: nitronate monooxygenase [Candidatus Dormibacteraceae bacterium]
MRDLACPIVVAPMAGGPSTPDLVVSALGAGAFGFLAGGYRTAAALRDEMREVRRRSDRPFGVNVFVPGHPTADPEGLADYLARLTAEGLSLGEARWDDDGWDAKLDLLRSEAPAVVSFTFGCPDRATTGRLQAVGSEVWVTVTSTGEGRMAAAAGADVLVVQGPDAGGHRGSFDDADPADAAPLPELLRSIETATGLPLVAAGGIASREGVGAALAAGARAVQCGTVFLRCPESGTNPVHRASLGDPRFTETALTRAFSGRLGRGLRNRFMEEHPEAPRAYPEINNATGPPRAAARRTGDADRVNLWAGTGFRRALEAPVGEVVRSLLPT